MDTEKLNSAGNEAFTKGDYVEAVYCYRKALKKEISDLSLYTKIVTNLGTTLFLLKNYSQAIEELLNLVSEDVGRNKTHFKAIYRIVQCFNANLDFNQAIRYAEIGLKIEPKSEPLLKELSIAKDSLQKPVQKLVGVNKEKLKLSKEIQNFVQGKIVINESFEKEVRKHLILSNFTDLHQNFTRIEKLMEIWKFFPKTRVFLAPILQEFATDYDLTCLLYEKIDIQFFLAEFLDDSLKDEEFLLFRSLETIISFVHNSRRSKEFISSLTHLILDNLMKILTNGKNYRQVIFNQTIHILPRLKYDFELNNKIFKSKEFINYILKSYENDPEDNNLAFFITHLNARNWPSFIEKKIWKMLRYAIKFQRRFALKSIYSWISEVYEFPIQETPINFFFDNINLLDRSDYSLIDRIGVNSEINISISAFNEVCSILDELSNSLLLIKDEDKQREEYMKAGRKIISQIKKSEVAISNFSLKNKPGIPFNDIYALIFYCSKVFETDGFKTESNLISSFFIMEDKNENLQYLCENGLKSSPKELYFLYGLANSLLSDEYTYPMDYIMKCLDIIKSNEKNLEKNSILSLNILLKAAEINFKVFWEKDEDYSFAENALYYYGEFFSLIPEDKHQASEHYARYLCLNFLIKGSDFSVFLFQELYQRFKKFDYWNDKIWKVPISAFRRTIDYIFKNSEKLSLDEPKINHGKSVSNKETKVCGACKSNNGKLKACSRCESIYYCNKECQLKDWKQHKVVCQKK